jgi:hypothetical protein
MAPTCVKQNLQKKCIPTAKYKKIEKNVQKKNHPVAQVAVVGFPIFATLRPAAPNNDIARFQRQTNPQLSTALCGPWNSEQKRARQEAWHKISVSLSFSLCKREREKEREREREEAWP